MPFSFAVKRLGVTPQVSLANTCKESKLDATDSSGRCGLNKDLHSSFYLKMDDPDVSLHTDYAGRSEGEKV
ncbi:hypothetical protein JOB18_027650 [Solea senegalensis]|uniref:Uncharacterized protein n=1 Tax=Solea senegalensis TaxID=28829 RepID=A0AAV6RKB7_SOLSE|nr:hypothetical protein JOB18_027650 [Solea senegalensis]